MIRKPTLRKTVVCIHYDQDAVYVSDSGCNTAQSIRLSPSCFQEFLEKTSKTKSFSFRLFATPQNAGVVLDLLNFYQGRKETTEIWLANPLKEEQVVSSVRLTLCWLRQPVPLIGTVGYWIRVQEDDKKNLVFQRDHELLGVLNNEVHSSFQDHPCSPLLPYCAVNPYFARLLKIISEPRWFLKVTDLFSFLGINRDSIERIISTPTNEDMSDRCRVAFNAWSCFPKECLFLPKTIITSQSGADYTRSFVSLVYNWWKGAQNTHPELSFYSYEFFGDEVIAEDFREKVGTQFLKKRST